MLESTQLIHCGGMRNKEDEGAKRWEASPQTAKVVFPEEAQDGACVPVFTECFTPRPRPAMGIWRSSEISEINLEPAPRSHGFSLGH